MAERGSMPTGPSEQYLRLLKGEISPKEYIVSVEKRVREPQRPATDPYRSTAAVSKSY